MKIKVFFLLSLICTFVLANAADKKDKDKEKEPTDKKAIEIPVDDTLTFPEDKFVEDTLVFEDYDSNNESGGNAIGIHNGDLALGRGDVGRAIALLGLKSDNSADLSKAQTQSNDPKPEIQPRSNNLNNTAEITVYPNPSLDGTIKIKSDFTGDLKFNVLSLNGQVIQSGQVGFEVLEITNLSPGVYILICTDNLQYKETKKFVVR